MILLKNIHCLWNKKVIQYNYQENPEKLREEGVYMKKAAAFLCMIVMAVCLSVGISAAEDAKAVYQAAREKTYSLVSVDFTQTEITKSVSETTSPGYSNVTTQEDTETTVLQINASDPANPQMKIEKSLATWGEDPLIEVYVKDSCLYVSLFGTGMKESMSAE